MWLSAVFILVGLDPREAGFDSWRRLSLQPFPEDLVIKLCRDTVFTGEVESAGFLRPVLRVMGGLQLGTAGEHDFVRVQSQASSLGDRGDGRRKNWSRQRRC